MRAIARIGYSHPEMARVLVRRKDGAATTLLQAVRKGLRISPLAARDCIAITRAMVEAEDRFDPGGAPRLEARVLRTLNGYLSR